MTKRSVSRMTPILKLRANFDLAAAAERDLDAAAADVDDDRGLRRVDAVDGGQVNEARLLGAGDDARPDAGLLLDGGEEVAAVLGLARGAGGGGEDLVDLVRVGEALELRERLQGRAHAPSRVSLRPSRPPAPRRTISFSRSMTSKERSGRTRTTIMWTELVPMSMAARRMEARVEEGPYNGRPNPSMQRPPLPVRLMRQRLLTLLNAMPAAATGDVTVGASRAGRVAAPARGAAGAGRGRGRPTPWIAPASSVRRITRALGPIRELDVALGHLDELGARAGVSARAMGQVRRHLTRARDAAAAGPCST